MSSSHITTIDPARDLWIHGHMLRIFRVLLAGMGPEGDGVTVSPRRLKISRLEGAIAHHEKIVEYHRGWVNKSPTPLERPPKADFGEIKLYHALMNLWIADSDIVPSLFGSNVLVDTSRVYVEKLLGGKLEPI